MVLQPTVSRDGVVKCNVISITHHDAPVDFVPISLLISLDRDNINDTKEKGVFRQAQTRITISSRRSGGEATASLSFAQISINSRCYSNRKTGRKKRPETEQLTHFSPKIGENHCEILFKTYCLWMKLACNHTDHRDRNRNRMGSSVLPFNLFMAHKQGERDRVSVASVDCQRRFCCTDKLS